RPDRRADVAAARRGRRASGGAASTRARAQQRRLGRRPSRSDQRPRARTRRAVVTDQAERPRLDRETDRLVGSRCTDCGAGSWPGRAVCHRCGSTAVQEWALPPEGRLLSVTTVRVPKPGLESPYVIGEVELAEGLRVYAH